MSQSSIRREIREVGGCPLGSEKWRSYLSPTTSCQHPVKGLALGARVRKESNLLPALQEFTA